MNGNLAEVIAALAGEIPLSQVLAWANLLRRVPGPGDEVTTRLIDARPSTAPHAARLMTAWRRHAPALPGEGVALALESAARIQAAAASRRSSIVVSGPTGDAVPVRLTVSVVTEIIRAATESLLVVSFAAYGVADITRELAAAADRGVRVDLVLETGVGDGGMLKGVTGATTFRSLRGRATFWHWPHERRPAGGSLHAKLIAADRRLALLGSANLTGRALADNIEAGVILRDPDAVAQVVSHFRDLMRGDAGPLEPLR